MASTNIEKYLASILAAVKGKEVRKSIYDAIREIYTIVDILNPEATDVLNELKIIQNNIKDNSTDINLLSNKIKAVTNQVSAAFLKDGIPIYPIRVNGNEITVSGASLKPNTKYRIEYFDINTTGIVINEVRFMVPNEVMDLEFPADKIEGGFEFTTSSSGCSELYFAVGEGSWDGSLDQAQVVLEGVFLSRTSLSAGEGALAEEVEKIKDTLDSIVTATELYHPELVDGEIDTSGELVDSNDFKETTEFMQLIPGEKITADGGTLYVHSYDTETQEYLGKVATLTNGESYVLEKVMLLRVTLGTNADIKVTRNNTNILNRLIDLEYKSESLLKKIADPDFIPIATDEEAGLMSPQHVAKLLFAIEDIKALDEEKLSIPYNDDGEVVTGNKDEVLHSNGDGTYFWAKTNSSGSGTSYWGGTKAEYDEAVAKGEIANGTIVYISDDETDNEEESKPSTTARLGEAILGLMVLG